MKTIEMEIALAKYFKFLINLVVPNISSGLNIHECDLLILTPSGYATEVEIKVSKSDLKKDAEKRHGHKSNKIKRLFFAIPEKIPIEFALEHIPERAGLIVVNKRGSCRIVKEPILNKNVSKFSEKDIKQMYRLGALRIWSLKKNNIKLSNEISRLKG